MTEIIDEKIATKQDLKELELRLKYDLPPENGNNGNCLRVILCCAHHVRQPTSTLSGTRKGWLS